MSRGTEWHIRIIGGMRRRGRSSLDRNIVSVALIGGIDLDLSEAEFTSSEVTLTLIALLGGVDITAPQGVNVVVGGFSLLGGRDIELTGEHPTLDVPVLRIRVFSLIGGVHVRNR
jgi:predicted membrane protein